MAVRTIKSPKQVGPQKQTQVTDHETHEFLEEIIRILKQIEFHLSEMTGEELDKEL